MIKRLFIATAMLFAASMPAFAHLNPAEHGSFMAGATHPLFGLDHVLVMVAVGLWAASLGGRALYAVPAAFVGMMALGFFAAIGGMALPFVEPVILASVIFVGVMVALALPIPASAVSALVAFFALFHGSAHGAELGGAGAWQFAIGFMAATALLHGVGIALGVGFGKLADRREGRMLTRIAGGLTAVGGVWLAVAG